jgi:hypothetical protein
MAIKFQEAEVGDERRVRGSAASDRHVGDTVIVGSDSADPESDRLVEGTPQRRWRLKNKDRVREYQREYMKSYRSRKRLAEG